MELMACIVAVDFSSTQTNSKIIVETNFIKEASKFFNKI
jgi:hypothetical protein